MLNLMTSSKDGPKSEQSKTSGVIQKKTYIHLKMPITTAGDDILKRNYFLFLHRKKGLDISYDFSDL